MSSKNRLRYSDNRNLTEAYEKAQQIVNKVLEQSSQSGRSINDLPLSVVPTDIMYFISLSLIVAYDQLTKHELVTGGYISKTNKQNLH